MNSTVEIRDLLKHALEPATLFSYTGIKNSERMFVRHLLIVLCIGCVVGRVGAQDVHYAVTAADHAYLNLLYSSNAFDSVMISHACGEFSISGLSGTRRIYTNSSLAGDSTLHNPATDGAQLLLRDALKTDVFYIESTDDSMRFFREFAVLPVSSVPGHRTSAWTFDDTTEFVIQLVRSSDDVVLLTLDSVGSLATSEISTATPRYGTSWDKYCRTVPLPAHVRGCSAYVRVEPRRWGGSTEGMQGYICSTPYSRSALSTCGTYHISVTAADALQRERFTRLLAYLDVYYNEFRRLPNMDYITLFVNEAAEIRQRYMKVKSNRGILDGGTVWTVHDDNDTVLKSSKQIPAHTISAGDVVISRVHSLNGALQLSVKASGSESDVEINVYNIDGRLVARPTSVPVKNGVNQLHTYITTHKGEHLVVLSALDGSFHVARKFAVP